jgi:hypothetical protein
MPPEEALLPAEPLVPEAAAHHREDLRFHLRRPPVEPEPKEPEPTLQEKIAILQSRFRGSSQGLQKSIPLADY